MPLFAFGPLALINVPVLTMYKFTGLMCLSLPSHIHGIFIVAASHKSYINVFIEI